MRNRKRIAIGLTIMLLVLAVVPLACTSAQNKIAVIPLNGPIQMGAASMIFGGSVITPQSVQSQLSRAKEDAAVRAVVIQIESPGGNVAACQEIINYMEQLGKPIVISMGSLVASGGYYISAGADKILALPGTLTGSIGVISQIPNLSGLYDKIGIEMEVFTGGKHKDMYAGVRELTPEEQLLMQELTDEFYDQFVQVVAEGRGLNEAKVRELATGQLYSGVQAKELGLVDELGGLQSAIDSAASIVGLESSKVVYLEPEVPSLLDTILGLNVQKLRTFVQMRSLGAEGVVLLETLSNPYPQPEYR